MSEITDLIRAVPLFAELDDEEFGQLEQMVETIGSLEGTVLFQKGDPSDSFYVESPDIQLDRLHALRNHEPLLVNRVNTMRLRPDAITGIDNLFLASIGTQMLFENDAIPTA